MTITFKGTQGSGANKHEGRGGWKISDYATVGRTFYRFDLTGLASNPGVGDIYSSNGSQFTVREVNITAGTGYFSTERTTGSTTPTAGPSTLTKVSGVGPASISYNTTSVATGNPLWDGTVVNYSHYLIANSIVMNSGDWFTIHLGINDVFGFTDDGSLLATINTMVIQLRAILTSVHTAVSGIRCGIMIAIPPAISQDGFGYSYLTGQTLKRYYKNIQAWQMRLIAEFSNSTEETAGNYLIPFCCVLDRTYNMQKALYAANDCNSADQVSMQTNGVHPAPGGYDQIGIQQKAVIKYYA
ncbi:hypothetical protein [Mucilaginibacter sp.]